MERWESSVSHITKNIPMTRVDEALGHVLFNSDVDRFLIGYSSSNIYCVWISAQNKVISTRDVIFNEDEFFNGNV